MVVGFGGVAETGQSEEVSSEYEMNDRTDIDVQAFKALLENRRVALTQLKELSGNPHRPVEVDQTQVGRLSRMDALQEQAMAIEAERRREAELAQIESALKRIEDGTYGYCVTCEEEIAVKRLEQDPSVHQCIECARKG